MTSWRERGLALLVLAGLALGAGLPAGGPARAYAEGRGLIIRLSYIRGYSTWGPTNVTGSAHLWPNEGVVVLLAHDLPHLLNGDMYVAWLVNTVSGESLRLDSFNTSQTGDAEMDKIFNQALPRGANALLVTVSHPGDPALAPGPQRTLAGYFPPQTVMPAAPQPTPGQPAATPTAVPVAPPTATPAAHTTPATHGTPSRPHHGPSRARRPIVVILPQTGGAAKPATSVAGRRCRRS